MKSFNLLEFSITKIPWPFSRHELGQVFFFSFSFFASQGGYENRVKALAILALMIFYGLVATIQNLIIIFNCTFNFLKMRPHNYIFILYKNNCKQLAIFCQKKEWLPQDVLSWVFERIESI